MLRLQRRGIIVIYSRRIRQRRGSANVMRVRGQSMAMAADLERAILAESADWEAKVRADERAKCLCDEPLRKDDPLIGHIQREYAADLRAKVKAIQAPPYVNKCDVSAFREALYVVLALFPEEKP